MARRRRRKPLTRAEAGRLGGKSTVRKYGPEHMRAIGKAGFAALRRKFGFNVQDPANGGGLGALRWLQRQGKIRGETPEQQRQATQEFEELLQQIFDATPAREEEVPW
jgi:hypothetical protein